MWAPSLRPQSAVAPAKSHLRRGSPSPVSAATSATRASAGPHATSTQEMSCAATPTAQASSMTAATAAALGASGRPGPASVTASGSTPHKARRSADRRRSKPAGAASPPAQQARQRGKPAGAARSSSNHSGATHDPRGRADKRGMSTTRRLTRAAWAALGVVVAVSAAAVVWRGLALPAFAIDALACVLTLRVTSTRLEALQSQALAREHESLHDPVTELPNRTLFHQQANQAIAAAARRAAACAVMLLDLDRFKEVNDTLGHHQGDLLLHHIATRLRQALRAGDLCARLGGDEFAVLVLDVAGAEEAFLVGQRLRRSLSESVELAGIALEVEASVGVSLCPDHGDDVEQLLRQADVAMYQAKRQHTGVELYSPQSDEGARAA